MEYLAVQWLSINYILWHELSVLELSDLVKPRTGHESITTALPWRPRAELGEL